MGSAEVTTAPRGNAVSQLLDTVLAGGYCIGCGACAAIPGSPMQMRLDEFGRYQAICGSLDSTPSLSVKSLTLICPFSAEAPNEDRIGRELFGSVGMPDSRVGYHLSTWAGHVEEPPYRAQGSSGGMGSWVLCELLDRSLVDAVVHVHAQQPTEADRRLFCFGISRSRQEILANAKSRYYPVELSQAMAWIRNNPGRYAIVGVPCFIKSVRLLTRQDPVLAERICFFVSLVCGHLKSTGFAESLAWQCGIAPDQLLGINFRAKLEGNMASDYGIEVTGRKASETVSQVRPMSELYGRDWGQGLFKYLACEYCDDVFGETADVSVGDAWLPQYASDWRGTNVVVVRHPLIDQLVKEAVAGGRLRFDALPVETVVQSQAAGLRHRREGLAYRLWLNDQVHQWRPTKRVQASNRGIESPRRKIYRLRLALAWQSHIAFRQAVENGSFESFVAAMNPLVKAYTRFYRPSLWKRIGARIKGKLKPIARVMLPLRLMTQKQD